MPGNVRAFLFEVNYFLGKSKALLVLTYYGDFSYLTQKFCNRATKAFVALAHQMPSSFRNSWSRFTDSVLQRLIPRGVITEVVFTQSNHSRT